MKLKQHMGLLLAQGFEQLPLQRSDLFAQLSDFLGHGTSVDLSCAAVAG
jgi:hypothetical protein